jgi:4-aminobutyrate aminotransferase / (S)-3-amino-2-methylpropionate transaminase / 5-aminovalerate transaminase
LEFPQERKLVTEVPGPRSQELMARRERAIPAAVFNTVPVFVEAASGAIVEDVDGNRLIDLGAGLAVLNAGNTPPEVVDAIREQAERFSHTCFHVLLHEPYVEVAERLNRLVPGDHAKKTVLVNAGAEAVENAVKVARYHTGRPAVLAFDHGFHGRTLLGMSLTAKARPYKHRFGPFAPEVYRLPYSYPYRCPAGASAEACGEACAELAIASVERLIGPENVACLVIEPVIGEGGFIVPGSGFIPALREFCSRHGIMFVADEVQTGIGRTGRWFGIEHEGVVPDMLASAKALGGGLPLAALTAPADILDEVHVGGLGGTFGGNPVACAAALAVLDRIDRHGLLERAERIGRVALGRLGQMKDDHPAVGDVRGRGAMVAIELVTDRDTKEPAKQMAARVIEECYRRGVIVLKAGSHDNVVRLLPPLSIDEELLLEGLDVLDEAVAAASA